MITTQQTVKRKALEEALVLLKQWVDASSADSNIATRFSELPVKRPIEIEDALRQVMTDQQFMENYSAKEVWDYSFFISEYGVPIAASMRICVTFPTFGFDAEICIPPRK